MPAPLNQRDYFAEMYVAGIVADAKWNVYFPRRDQGFDFIMTKTVGSSVVVRPVQVKGKYPESVTASRPAYGYSGRLSQTHPNMVLAIPFFTTNRVGVAPACIAYALREDIKTNQKGEFVCIPATLRAGSPAPRRDFGHLFDSPGLLRLERTEG